MTTFAVSNGAGGGMIISESKDSSYADLDWSEVNTTIYNYYAAYVIIIELLMC